MKQCSDAVMDSNGGWMAAVARLRRDATRISLGVGAPDGLLIFLFREQFRNLFSKSKNNSTQSIIFLLEWKWKENASFKEKKGELGREGVCGGGSVDLYSYRHTQGRKKYGVRKTKKQNKTENKKSKKTEKTGCTCDSRNQQILIVLSRPFSLKYALALWGRAYGMKLLETRLLWLLLLFWLLIILILFWL